MKARGPFPRWESALPKQDWRSRRSLEIAVGSARRSTKIRVFIDEIGTRDWPAACNRRESWTHSDRRLSQVREREGRGLLKDECWSFPPASEREARMDDPTPRSKKGRETECVFRGLLFPSKGPHLFYFYFGPTLTRIVHRKCTARALLNLRYRSHWLHAPQHGNPRLPEHVLDFRLF